MPRNETIRTFLESPNTLELRSEAEVKPKVQKRHRKRKARLPPYVPFRSMYEEQDMSKLTERQRIMVLKFRSAGDKINPLFLTANGICNPFVPDDRCVENAKQLIEFLKWLTQKDHLDSDLKTDAYKAVDKTEKLLESVEGCVCNYEVDIYKNVYQLIKRCDQKYKNDSNQYQY